MDNVQVLTLNDDDFEKYFENSQETIDRIEGKTQPEPKKIDAVEEQIINETKPKLDIPVEGSIDLDDYDIEEQEEKNETPSEEKETQVKAKENKSEEKVEKIEKVESDDEISAVLKTSAEYLIKKGIWAAWDNWEDEEWSDESWASMLEQQAEFKTTQKINEARQSSDFINAVIEYQDLGGDPSTMIDLFQKQQSVKSNFDTTTDDGKRAYILEYNTKIQGIKKSKAEKLLEMEEEESGLDAAFAEVEEKYRDHFKREQEQLIAQQEADKKQEIERKNNVRNSLISELKSQKFETKEGNEILNFITTPAWKYNGVEMTDMEYQYMQLQKDPSKAIKLAKFLKYFDTYDDLISNQKKNEVTTKIFKDLKSVKPKASSKEEETPKSKFKFDTSVVFE